MIEASERTTLDDAREAVDWRLKANGNFVARYRGRRLVLFERPDGWRFLVAKPDGKGGETTEWARRSYAGSNGAAFGAYEVAERKSKRR